MPNKAQNLKPDTILKNYWSNNEQFADLFNAVLFQGRQLILPEELEELDTKSSFVSEHGDYAESLQSTRDVIKIQKKSLAFGVNLVMYGLEDQEHVHYGMPLRLMGYDYSAYKKQFDRNGARYKTGKGLTEDEFLSRMKKTDKFIPVITLVIYYGEKPWDGPLSLREMLNIPQEIAEYVNDYRMLLVEARQNNLVLRNVNNSDFFHLLSILLEQDRTNREKRDSAIRYAEESGLDSSVAMAAAVTAKVPGLNYNELIQKKGAEIMYSVFEETKEEGRLEGRQEGRLEGRLEGKLEGKLEGRAEGIIEVGMECSLSKKQILDILQKKLDVTLDKAEEYFQVYQQKDFNLQS